MVNYLDIETIRRSSPDDDGNAAGGYGARPVATIDEAEQARVTELIAQAGAREDQILDICQIGELRELPRSSLPLIIGMLSRRIANNERGRDPAE